EGDAKRRDCGEVVPAVALVEIPCRCGGCNRGVEVRLVENGASAVAIQYQHRVPLKPVKGIETYAGRRPAGAASAAVVERNSLGCRRLWRCHGQSCDYRQKNLPHRTPPKTPLCRVPVQGRLARATIGQQR